MTDDTYSGVVAGVYANELGDKVAVAPTVPTSTLQVYDVVDFDEDGGWLRLNGAILAYTTVDDDTSTITLVTPLLVTTAVDSVVDVWDMENAQPATIYKAVIDGFDGFDGKPVEAIVPQGVAHSLATTMRDGKGESVTISRDEGGELTVSSVNGRTFALAALQYLQGGMTTRQAEDEAGIDITGADSGDPGVGVYSTSGLLQMLLSADAAGGIFQFWTGNVFETGPGWINPVVVGGGPGVSIASPKTSSGQAEIQLFDTLVKFVQPFGGFVEFTRDVVVDATMSANIIECDGAIHSAAGGVFMDDLAGAPANTGASINTNGRIIRTTSSERYKDDIEPLTLEDARKVLGMQLVAFKRKDEADNPDRRTYAGLLAEQAAEVGAELWVDRDAQGRPDGIRYAELTAALIPIVRGQDEQIRDQQDRIERLEALVSNLIDTRETSNE